MSKEILPTRAIPSLDQQREEFFKLQGNYCEVLRGEGIRVKALLQTPHQQRSYFNATTETLIYLGDISEVHEESAQTLGILFDTPFKSPSGEPRSYRCLVPVVDLYPANDEWEVHEGFTDEDARILMAMGRGLLRAQIEYLPAMSSHFDTILEISL